MPILASILVMAGAGCTKVEVSRSGAAVGARPGVLRFSTRNIDNLNTVVSGGGTSTYLSFLWGAYLYLTDDKGNLRPDLATDIPTQSNGGISRDGLTITYHLRHGVRWHDGAPFDARDVVFTWHAIMNPKNNVATRLGYEKVAAMTIVDRYTVRVRLKQRYAPAVSSLFGPGEVPMPILPQHILGSLPDINRAAYNNKPLGTGPFVIDDYQPSTGVFLKANPHYWRGSPKLRGIDYLIVPDPNTVMVMLRSNELDVAAVSDTDAAELAKAPGVTIVREPTNQNAFLAFNEQRPPLDDVRVRRAIAMTVDRKFFVHAFQYDTGSVAESDQPPFLWSFDPSVRAPSYNPAKAERLLDEAGWHMDQTGYRTKNGKQLSLIFVFITGRDPDVRYAAVFQSAMKQIGVAVDLKSFPYNIFYAQKAQGGILTGGHYDIASTGWVGGVDPDDATLWMCDQWPPQGYNWSFSCDKRVDQQERIALTTYDQRARRQAYWRIQKLLEEDVPVAFISWQDIIYATRDSIKDFKPGTNYWASWDWRKE